MKPIAGCAVAAAPRALGGVERLYGAEGWQRLASAHVTVIGVGGVGSWAVEALARSGVGRLTLIDLDNIAESNINRQLPALLSLVGMPKIEALRRRIADINPVCRVDLVEDFVDESNVAALIPECSFVIDAIDAVRAKAALAAYCVSKGLPLVMSGGAGGQRHPECIRSADLVQVRQDRLLANVRYRLRKQYGFARDGEPLGVRCIYSTETVAKPAVGEGTAAHGLACAGYGSGMVVTAAFGLYCAHAAIETIVGTL